MRPIKAKTLIPKVAELTEFPEETCFTLITFYYKVLREKLSQMEEPCIQVEKMGNFYLKEKMMDRREESYLRIQERVKLWPDGIRRTNILRKVEEELEKIKRNKEKIQKRRDKRTATIKRQHEFREAQKDLEGKTQDSTGLVE